MWRTANALMSGLVVVLALIVGLGLLGITAALEWGHFDKKITLMLELLRWVFPYLMLICLAAAVMGILNSRGHFFMPALGALILNVVMIASVLFLAPRWGVELEDQIFALAVGVLVAGVAQLLYQLPTLWREGFRPQWISPWADDSVLAILQRLGPGVIGVAAFQLNVLVTYCIGFFVGEHVVASYGYAVRLLELPQGLFAVSMATFLLPALSGLAAEKKFDDFRNNIDEAARHLLFLNLPAAVLLFVLAEPIVQLLFQYGEFTAAATERAAWALRCLAPALPGYSLVLILARAFYALGDIKTPVRISITCLGINLVVALVLVNQFESGLRQGAFGIANTISSTLNAALLWRALRRKEELAPIALPGLRKQLPAMAVIAALTGVIGWGVCQELGGDMITMTARLKAVFLPLLGAGVLYWLLSTLAGIDSPKAILGIFRPTKRE
jgi:putative peptidoglycan lipid II flippase